MRNAIIGIIIGVVLGMVLGTSVIAPRIPQPEIVPEPEEAAAKPDPAPPEPLKAHTHNWNLASTIPPDMPLYGESVTGLVERVAHLLTGDLELRLHKPDALIPIGETLQAVASGTVEAAFAPASFWAEQSPTLGLIGGAPFGLGPAELLAWLDKGGGAAFHRQAYEKLGVVALACGIDGPRVSGWYEKPIRNLSDFKDMKIGASGLEASLFKRLGAEVRHLTPADMVTALKLDVVDSVVALMPSADQSLGLGKQAPYSYWPAWHHQGGVLDLLVHPESWEALSPRLQSALATVCSANMRLGLSQAMDQFEPLKAQQMGETPPASWTNELLAEFRAEWDKDSERLAAMDKLFAKTRESQAKFRHRQAIWHDLARHAPGEKPEK
ncbi:hypothetical protein [Magnetospira sp. QH-2]|uniref:hypothetical protein n=1 Tax=Magnetospira sp. (strain QH-2) TaxID=1288970 RepID=UPI0003E8172C|nr:hypothetical protein [Magnetospira sp. QH-2]CCQ73908.1 Protein of unknown function [Magnetospira sp. QH-2]